MKIIGGKPTSPKAARGKAGIRPDIDPNINLVMVLKDEHLTLQSQYSLYISEWEFSR